MFHELIMMNIKILLINISNLINNNDRMRDRNADYYYLHYRYKIFIYRQKYPSIRRPIEQFDFFNKMCYIELKKFNYIKFLTAKARFNKIKNNSSINPNLSDTDYLNIGIIAKENNYSSFDTFIEKSMLKRRTPIELHRDKQFKKLGI